MSKLGERFLRSAKEARAIARGEIEPARVFTPPAIDVAAVRKKIVSKKVVLGNDGRSDL